MYNKLSMALGTALAVGVAGVAGGAMAKVEGDTIILGSAISLSGKYSTNGLHTQRGYDFAVDRINEMGGVKVGGKSYKLSVKYYDDESTPARATQLAERLIQQDGVEFMLGPYGTGLTKAVAPVTEKFGVPMVEAEGASRSLFTQGYKGSRVDTMEDLCRSGANRYVWTRVAGLGTVARDGDLTLLCFLLPGRGPGPFR